MNELELRLVQTAAAFGGLDVRFEFQGAADTLADVPEGSLVLSAPGGAPPAPGHAARPERPAELPALAHRHLPGAFPGRDQFRAGSRRRVGDCRDHGRSVVDGGASDARPGQHTSRGQVRGRHRLWGADHPQLGDRPSQGDYRRPLDRKFRAGSWFDFLRSHDLPPFSEAALRATRARLGVYTVASIERFATGSPAIDWPAGLPPARTMPAVVTVEPGVKSTAGSSWRRSRRLSNSRGSPAGWGLFRGHGGGPVGGRGRSLFPWGSRLATIGPGEPRS
jgi:hypothetical protein